MGRMATDFRSGHDFPRSARETYGGFTYLLRAFDKGRAARNGTIHDFIYPCPIDLGVFEKWGITADEFTAALETCTSDEQILAWVRERVPQAKRDAADRYLVETWLRQLDKHDREENYDFPNILTPATVH